MLESHPLQPLQRAACGPPAPAARTNHRYINPNIYILACKPMTVREPDRMNPQVSVHIFEEFGKIVSPDWIRAVVRGVLSTQPEWLSENVSVVIADDESVAELNRAHRGLNETTDVLSFSNRHSGKYYGDDEGHTLVDDDTEFVLPPGFSADLGEVVVSYPQVERQAREAGHTAQKELVIMLAHGILHLLGYDHERQAEAVEMFSLQDQVMIALDDCLGA